MEPTYGYHKKKKETVLEKSKDGMIYFILFFEEILEETTINALRFEVCFVEFHVET